MKVSLELSRGSASPEDRSASIENPTVPVSQTEEFMAFFGMDRVPLPVVTTASALKVPAVNAAVNFLSRTLAALPLHAFLKSDGSAERENGIVEAVLRNPTPEMNGFKARQYFWQCIFTGGRGLFWIERKNKTVFNTWPLNPAKTRARRRGLSTVYVHDGVEYPAADVIDIAYMLKDDQLGHYGPIALASKAIQLSLAMNDYASTFFAGGGVPPLSLSGALATGNDGLKRTTNDVERAIKFAQVNGSPIMPIPAGYELKAVGIDPAKGQMVEARLLQVQEIARAYQLPPMFLQDLTKGNFANTEQQDLHLVKHLIGQWAKALEAEATLKIYGREDASSNYVEHNLDGLQRGDFKSRIEALARGIQTAQISPNEARALENRPKHKNPHADELLVQGATVVLGQQPTSPAPANPTDNGEGDEPKAA
ncbi:portal protein [Devosia sp. H5989]|nr:portal protein [Devosia sp. H5989]